MKEKINLSKHSASVTEYFSPKIIGEVNDVFVKIAKIKGEDVPWHNHKNEDELFYIIDGKLLFEVEGAESFMMEKGDLFIVQAGVNHRVSSEDECTIMLVENKTTLHLGEVDAPIAKSVAEQMGNG